MTVFPIQEPNQPRVLPPLDPPKDGYSDLICSIAFSPDSRLLGIGRADTTVCIVDLSTGRQIHRIEGHLAQVYSVAFSPDGRFLATGSADCSISMWGVETGQEYEMFDSHEAKVMSVAFTYDGKFLVSGSLDGTLRVWDVLTKTERYCLVRKIMRPNLQDCRLSPEAMEDGNSILGVACSPNAAFAATIHDDGRVVVWDIERGKQLRLCRTKARQNRGDDAELTCIAFMPCGDHIAVGSQAGRFQFWPLRKGQPTGRSLESESRYGTYARHLSFSPDGKYMASTAQDQNYLVEIWDVAGRKRIQTLSDPIASAWKWSEDESHENDYAPQVWEAAFSPDGRILAAADNDRILIWDLQLPEQKSA